jgi:hypothetical protein
MDKWEKVVTLKRKLTDLKDGLSLAELLKYFGCDCSTIH